ncbi:putative phosphatidate phosphatase [Clavispora lusitaniae]|uniref:Phosphatidate phosphatase n=1 Tax=Clavispora lusitaniae TaxID=36911 RepID=A0AA91Q078_CLALS|nr:putative phosphatidate phosphatase [Clavispora lusitaniae]
MALRSVPAPRDRSDDSLQRLQRKGFGPSDASSTSLARSEALSGRPGLFSENEGRESPEPNKKSENNGTGSDPRNGKTESNSSNHNYTNHNYTNHNYTNNYSNYNYSNSHISNSSAGSESNYVSAKSAPDRASHVPRSDASDLSESEPSLSGRENLSPEAPSRRQRLWGMARAARDTYIPRLASSVSALASGRSDDLIPRGSTITLFPTYSRRTPGGYVVSVRGWVWCPGVMSRKNRLILSLARQIVRSQGAAAAQAVSQLENPALRQDSVSETPDTESISSVPPVPPSRGESDVLVRDRLAPFLARSVSAAGISVLVGAASPTEGRLVEVSAVTDANGHFEADVEVSYEPSVVRVAAQEDEEVTAFQEVCVLEDRGLGIISDIDDTVKVTGVVGDKRELMSRLLAGDIGSWNIPRVVEWYKAWARQADVSFHYVSNSPWQLFALIQQYFDTVGLPPGSIHLKQYTGNIISSLMEPSSSRKRKSLFQVVAHFPHKTFVCVGDSGEQDLEAYADLAASYPGRISAIYIRMVPGSVSDVDDALVLAELRRMIRTADMSDSSKTESTDTQASQLQPVRSSSTSTAPKRLSSDSSSSKPKPPMVPRKPQALRAEKIPPLPERKYLGHAATDSALELRATPPPPPPPRRRTTMPQSPDIRTGEYRNSYDTLQQLYGLDEFNELEDFDKRGALWLQRIADVLEELKGTGTRLFLFEDDDEECFEQAVRLVSRLSEKCN